MITNESMNSTIISRINTKTVTKLVLLAEILAISILHTVKASNEKQSPQTFQQQVKNIPFDKPYTVSGNISFTHNQN